MNRQYVKYTYLENIAKFASNVVMMSGMNENAALARIVANDIYEKIKETGAEVISDNYGEVDEKMMQKLKGAAIYGRMFGENDNQN